MEIPGHQLRRQVAAERKKRRLIFLTFVFLSFVYLILSLVLGDMGLLHYRELDRKRHALENEISRLDAENTRTRAEIRSIKEDPYIREKYAREEYKLAQPGDIIIEYDKR
jgi:cell division protein FtsB